MTWGDRSVSLQVPPQSGEPDTADQQQGLRGTVNVAQVRSLHVDHVGGLCHDERLDVRKGVAPLVYDDFDTRPKPAQFVTQRGEDTDLAASAATSTGCSIRSGKSAANSPSHAR